MVELHELKELLNTQDNRITAHPLYCVCDYRKIWSNDECFENYLYTSEDCEYEFEGTKEALIEEALEMGYEIPDDCEDEEDIYEFLHRECQIQKYYYVQIREIKNVFLTEKGAADHIEQNHYHYNEPHIYVSCAWRNPEMQKVQEYFKTVDITEDE